MLLGIKSSGTILSPRGGNWFQWQVRDVLCPMQVHGHKVGVLYIDGQLCSGSQHLKNYYISVGII